MYYVIYEMKDGTEQVFGPFNSEDLKHERAQAAREKSQPDTYVLDYRVSSVDPRTQPQRQQE